MSRRQRARGCARASRFWTATAARVAGRWDDPAAWRLVCEELVHTWRDEPAVGWAALVARNGLAAGLAADDPASPSAVLWSAAKDSPCWCDLEVAPSFWSALDAAAASVLVGEQEGTSPLQSPVPGAAPRGLAGGWLAGGVAGPRGASLAIVLGLQDRTRAETLGDDLRGLGAMIAPLLGMQRRLVDLGGVVATARSECEALSRLGELRARLAAVTAHELKTPLTSITAYAEVLEQQIGNPDFTHAEEFLRVIRGEADRLLRLVDRLLDSSRRGRGPVLVSPQPVAAGALIQEARRIVAPQAAARDLHLEVQIPDDLPRLEGDADLIRQVLLNLLGNALKFTPTGGRVVLSAREDSATVRLAVADSGPGIAPQDLRAIFQSFYRTRAAARTEGIGLGLSIVKEIVNLHGGHLDVHSRQGRGATFGVHLPKELDHADLATSVTEGGCDPALQRRLATHSLRLVAELAGARGVAVLLPAIGGGGLVVAAALGLRALPAGTMVAAGDGVVRDALGAPLMTDGAAGLPAVLAAVSDRPGAMMAAPLPLADHAAGRGLLLAARRLHGALFGADDLLLLRVLAEILGEAWSAAVAARDDRRAQETVTEALAALAGLRRGGIPTADPLALRLLSDTAKRLGMSAFEVRLLQYACALHDAGMMLLDPEVVHKPAVLDIDERDHIGRHPQRTIDLLGPLVALPELQAIIRHHHERVDGHGYPEGRSGEAIPLGARLLAVVDAFFAMIRSRPWREGLPVGAAVSELERHAGSQFDARVVNAFLDTLLNEGLLTEATGAPAVGTTSRR